MSDAAIAALVVLGFGAMLARRRSHATLLVAAQAMLLGVAALVLVVLLVFSRDPAPNEPVEPRGQTQNAPK